jgi:hypothetical protein
MVLQLHVYCFHKVPCRRAWICLVQRLQSKYSDICLYAALVSTLHLPMHPRFMNLVHDICMVHMYAIIVFFISL